MERSRIVSNRHLFDLAIKLGLGQIVVERKLEPSVSWQPPGFSRQALENILIDLDTRFPSLVDVVNSRNLGGGSLLNWLRPEDLELLESSEEEDTTRVIKEPRPGGVDEGKVGRLNKKSQLQRLGVHADDDIQL